MYSGAGFGFGGSYGGYGSYGPTYGQFGGMASPLLMGGMNTLVSGFGQYGVSPYQTQSAFGDAVSHIHGTASAFGTYPGATAGSTGCPFLSDMYQQSYFGHPLLAQPSAEQLAQFQSRMVSGSAGGDVNKCPFLNAMKARGVPVPEAPPTGHPSTTNEANEAETLVAPATLETPEEEVPTLDAVPATTQY